MISAGELTTLPAHQIPSGISGVYFKVKGGKGRGGRKGERIGKGRGEKGSTFHNLSKNDPRYQMAGHGPEILLDSANWQRPDLPSDFILSSFEYISLLRWTSGQHTDNMIGDNTMCS